MIVSSNANSVFENESYLFRNVQLFSYRCYKTCQTCSGEGKDQCISCYSDIQSISSTCDNCKQKLEMGFLHIPIGCVSKCPDGFDFDEDQVCFDNICTIYKSIQDSSANCQEDCYLCKNRQSCLVCNSIKFQYFGQCFDRCPDFTKGYGVNCFNAIDELQSHNLKFVQLVQEFHDLSTTKERIDQLFVMKQQDGKDFQKGNNIYFSYLQKKRIFGGPFIWVNAKFEFKLNWVEDIQLLRIRFEILLGDAQFGRTSFGYQIHQLQQNIITLATSYQGIHEIIEDHNWPDQYKYNIYLIDQTIDCKNIVNKEIKIQFQCQNQDQLGFCGMQNLIIIGIFDCDPEYKFDQFNYDTNRNPCIPICGDQIVVGDEECDDGNNNPFDGCFNCRYQCQENCQVCIKGECIFEQIILQPIEIDLKSNIIQFSCHLNCNICINDYCLQCEQGYYLNQINNLCETNCGDSILQGSEQCDDDLSKHRCSVCYFGKCLKCYDGFLLENDICLSICGDGLLNLIEEECDSQEDQGCINCKIQKGYICGQLNFSTCRTCDIQCTKCISIDNVSLSCHSCMDGYYPIEDKCFQCDSNCITCSKTSNMCIMILNYFYYYTSCFRNDCDFCESTNGLIADIKSKQCISICGDGILVESYEQCDDHNQNEGDGCDSQCYLEFSNDNLSQVKNYQFFGNNTYNLNLINISSSLLLLCDTTNVTIENIESQYYNYTSEQIDDLTCKLQFDFMKSVFKFNTIHVKIQYSKVKNRILFQQDNEVINFDIDPIEYIVISKDKLILKEQIKSVQQSFNLIFLILIPISIVTNLFQYLWAVLEILSWINNFYFLNVKYPFNIEIFLLNCDWSSFISFPTYQGLNQPDSSYYIEAPTKFKNKGIDPLFFNNIQIPFMFILSAIILYFINYLIYLLFSFLNQLLQKKITIKAKTFSIFNIQIKKIRYDSTKKEQSKIYQNPYLKSITRMLKSSLIQFKNKIKQTMSLCLLDIRVDSLNYLLFIFYDLFSHQMFFKQNYQKFFQAIILLQSYFNYHFQQTLPTLLQAQTSFLLSQLQAQSFINCTNSIRQQIFINFKLRINNSKNNTECISQRKDLLLYYENINTKSSYGYYFQFFRSIGKILYIFFMVNYYYTPIVQTTLCFVSSSLGFVFLFYQNPYEQKKQLCIELVSNFCLSQIIFIVVLLSINDHKNIQFIEKNKDIFGWLIISLVILAISAELCSLVIGLIFHFYQIFKKIYEKFSKYLMKTNRIQEQQKNQTIQQPVNQKLDQNEHSSQGQKEETKCSIVLF